MLSAAVERAGKGTAWPPLIIAGAALLFTVASFWWLHWRRGKLRVAAPQTYAATWDEDKMSLLFPFVFYNTGPRAYVIRDLRLRFVDESARTPMDWERVRNSIQPSQSPGLELAAAFPVPGGSAVRVFAEFDRRPAGRIMDARSHPVVLEVLTDKSNRWSELVRFDLHVSAKDAQTMTTNFVAFRSRA